MSTNSNFSECEHYDTCHHIRKEFESLRVSDASQEASLKSMHIRLTQADEKREQSNKTLENLVNSLKHHMEWEENEAKHRRDEKEAVDKAVAKEKLFEKEKKDFRLKVATVLFGVVFAVVTWFTNYVFDSIQASKKSINAIDEYHRHNDKHVDSIDNSLEEIKKLLYKISK